MIKQKYQEPEMVVENMSFEAIVTTSGSMGLNGEGQWDNEDIKDRDGFFQ